MPRQKKAPELTFQQHIADFLVREHRYGVLEQADITDTDTLAELAASTDEGRESFRVTLVELRAKIDSFLSPSTALA